MPQSDFADGSSKAGSLVSLHQTPPARLRRRQVTPAIQTTGVDCLTEGSEKGRWPNVDVELMNHCYPSVERGRYGPCIRAQYTEGAAMTGKVRDDLFSQVTKAVPGTPASPRFPLLPPVESSQDTPPWAEPEQSLSEPSRPDGRRLPTEGGCWELDRQRIAGWVMKRSTGWTRRHWEW